MFSKDSKPLSNAGRIVVYLLILLPVALAFLYVHRFGVNVPFRDSWSVVPLFGKLADGTLGMQDLWPHHTESAHRIFFPLVASLALGTLTEYNTLAEMHLTLSCLLVTLVVLLLVFRDSIGRGWKLLLFVPVALLVFSLRQHFNMLSGFQIAFSFAQAFSVLALYFLYRMRKERFREIVFAAALTSATVATFSAAQGLFVWPAGVVMLLLMPLDRPAKKFLVGAWALIGMIEWIAHFRGYTHAERRPSLSNALEHPVSTTEYSMKLLGSSLFGQPTPALVSGLFLATLAVASLFLVFRHRKWSACSFWIAFLCFSLFSLASIIVARSGSVAGVDQALVSKYTTFSVLVVVGVYAILVKLALDTRLPRLAVLPGALSVLVLLSLPFSFAGAIEEGRKLNAEQDRAAFALSTYESQSDEILREYIHKKPKTQERAIVLEKLGYSVFSDRSEPRLLPPLSELAPAQSTTRANISRVNGDPVTKQGQSFVIPEGDTLIEVNGWAMDAEAGGAAGGVYVEAGGELFPTFYGDPARLENKVGIPTYGESGFEVHIPVYKIGSGTHELSLVVLTKDRERYYRSDQEVTLEIR